MTVALIDYALITAAVDAVLDDHRVPREGGAVYDYWSATEAACFKLGADSGSALGNFVDGMIVDAVADKWGPLPDSRLTKEAPAP